MKRSCLLLAALLAAGTAYADPPDVPSAPGTETAAPVRTASQQFAFERLMGAARFLGKADRFSVSMHVNYDVVQENGEKIEFGEQCDILLQRPDKLRIAKVSSSGEGERLLFDGKSITVFNRDAKVFAQTAQPGTIDDSVVYFVRDLQMHLPIAPMLLTGFADELQRRIDSIDYVGRTELLGKPAHQIAVRAAKVDFQMWIAETPQPLPLRVVITYRSAPGQPQFRADFSQWNLSPRVVDTDFTFKPPADAKPIAFAAQMMAPSMNAPAVNTTEQGVKP